MQVLFTQMTGSDVTLHRIDCIEIVVSKGDNGAYARAVVPSGERVGYRIPVQNIDEAKSVVSGASNDEPIDLRPCQSAIDTRDVHLE